MYVSLFKVNKCMPSPYPASRPLWSVYSVQGWLCLTKSPKDLWSLTQWLRISSQPHPDFSLLFVFSKDWLSQASILALWKMGLRTTLILIVLTVTIHSTNVYLVGTSSIWKQALFQVLRIHQETKYRSESSVGRREGRQTSNNKHKLKFSNIFEGKSAVEKGKVESRRVVHNFNYGDQGRTH